MQHQRDKINSFLDSSKFPLPNSPPNQYSNTTSNVESFAKRPQRYRNVYNNSGQKNDPNRTLSPSYAHSGPFQPQSANTLAPGQYQSSYSKRNHRSQSDVYQKANVNGYQYTPFNQTSNYQPQSLTSFTHRYSGADNAPFHKQGMMTSPTGFYQYQNQASYVTDRGPVQTEQSMHRQPSVKIIRQSNQESRLSAQDYNTSLPPIPQKMANKYSDIEKSSSKMTQSRSHVKQNDVDYRKKPSSKNRLKSPVLLTGSKVSSNSKKQYFDKANKKISLKKDFSSKYGKSEDGTKFTEDLQSGQSDAKNQAFESEKQTQNKLNHFRNSQFSDASTKQKTLFNKRSTVGAYTNFERIQPKIIQNRQSTGTDRNQKNSDSALSYNKTSKNSPKEKSNPIDTEIYTDMKISRIEETTLSLEEKLKTMYTFIKSHSTELKQHKILLREFNQFMKKRQESSGVTVHDIAHDMKRVKKEIKIINTSFQTAFSSMTDQINRKLLRQQSIMKSLTQDISILADDNKNIKQSLQHDQQSINNLNGTISSYMKENDERLENVINDSFRSQRRNSSLQYGLDLKSMNSQDSMRQGYDGLSKKMDQLQREIKKMKIFHIEEQKTHTQKVQQVNANIKQLQQGQQRLQKERLQLTNRYQTQTRSKMESLKQQISLVKEQSMKKYQELKKSYLQPKSKQFYPKSFNHINSQVGQTSQQPQFMLSQSFKTDLQDIKSKQKAYASDLSLTQSKLNQLDQKLHNVCKSEEQKKLRDIKTASDIRQLGSKLNEQLSQQQAKTTDRFKQLDKINSVQTQNIESINNQFQRVINKEIIPKFNQIHQLNGQMNFKISSMVSQIGTLKANSAKANTAKPQQQQKSASSSVPNFDQQKSTLPAAVQKNIKSLIENHFSTKYQQLLKKIKIIKTKELKQQSQSRIQLEQFGVLKSSNTKQNTNQRNITYLIDENGFLMDSEGYYLMEQVDGKKRNIELSQQDVYFMQANGVNILQTG